MTNKQSDINNNHIDEANETAATPTITNAISIPFGPHEEFHIIIAFHNLGYAWIADRKRDLEISISFDIVSISISIARSPQSDRKEPFGMDFGTFYLGFI